MFRHSAFLKSVAALGCVALCSGLSLADSTRVRFAPPKGAVLPLPGALHANSAELKTVEAPAPKALVADEGTSNTEVITLHYPNRKIKIKRHVIQDSNRNYVNHGPWTMWDVQGNIIASGNYKFGKRDGTWSRLQASTDNSFKTAVRKGFSPPFVWETEFKDSVLNGSWIVLDAEGRRVASWEFADGRLHGESIHWHANGKKRSSAKYQQGLPHGAQREWGQGNSEARGLNLSGKLMRKSVYVNGRRYRKYVQKNAAGQLLAEGLFLGPEEMTQVSFNWWEGTVNVKPIVAKGKEVRHGDWSYWHANGSRKYQGAFKIDQAVGVHTWWHPNGHKRLEGEFVNGKEDGRWTWWHVNGQKRQSGIYLVGQKIGEWVEWDMSGKLNRIRDLSAKGETKPASDGEEANTAKQLPPRVGTAARPLMRELHGRSVPEILRRWRERNAPRRRLRRR